LNQLTDLSRTFESLWPAAGAESWDAPGFVTSHSDALTGVLLTVDVTGAVLAEAHAKGCNLVVSHHPFLLKGTQEIKHDSLKGSVLSFALKHSIAVFAAHTNADIVEDGVSDAIAKKLGLTNIEALVATGESVGHGRIGRLVQPMQLQKFAALVAEVLPFSARGVSVAGDPDQEIATVALCGGAGDSFIDAALASVADVYVTSDLRHHPTLDARLTPREKPLALIDVSHWAAESLWLESASQAITNAHEGLPVHISEVVTDPWVFSINRGER
jgi:dinuclear metal center YbgI/SA1388 family protein